MNTMNSMDTANTTAQALRALLDRSEIDALITDHIHPPQRSSPPTGREKAAGQAAVG
ncbi:hypothetical protein AB0I49_04725 [Streptomyces sp. NPDC050617]|uniref:hypothetical protein n=1 Tax=Streptomyces sp. NPDC050617 TaxID=3154628 RepID=UPI0034166B2E